MIEPAFTLPYDDDTLQSPEADIISSAASRSTLDFLTTELIGRLEDNGIIEEGTLTPLAQDTDQDVDHAGKNSIAAKTATSTDHEPLPTDSEGGDATSSIRSAHMPETAQNQSAAISANAEPLACVAGGGL